MMKTRGSVLCLSFLVLGWSAGWAAGSPINLLSNPSFETGDLTGWTVGGPNGGSGVLADGATIPGVTYSGYVPSHQNVRSGSFGAYAVTAATALEYVSFSQTLDLPAGQYTAGFYMGNDQGGVFGIATALADGLLGISVNGSPVPFNSAHESNFPTGSSPADFTLFEADFRLSNAAGTSIEFRISGSGLERAGISVDDFGVFAVPAPGASSSAPSEPGWSAGCGDAERCNLPAKSADSHLLGHGTTRRPCLPAAHRAPRSIPAFAGVAVALAYAGVQERRGASGFPLSRE